MRKQRGETIAVLCHFYGYTPDQVRGLRRSDLDILIKYIGEYRKAQQN